MKERCRDGYSTFLLIAGDVLVPAIIHTSLPPCHPYITNHFMEIFFFNFNNKTVFTCAQCPHNGASCVYACVWMATMDKDVSMCSVIVR